VSTAEGEHTMTLSLPAHSPVIWVAAQELITAGWYEQWLRELDAGDDVNVRLFGSSVQGRPLYVAETAARPEFVVLLGRQHPPEVTGALAMRPFVQALMGGTALARSFRERYQVIIAPLMNPDGVALGHWRHNVNGVDLNRDWGSFTQAETAAFAAELQKLEATGARAAFMLDFHSTKRSLFYTQLASDFPGDEDFATTWLERSRKRMPDYEFSHEARARSGQGNSKNWYFGNYGIPAITYEIGDEVARDDIARSSSIFAEEFMRLMLDAPPPY
ncbi:MAG: succinylglutamate desuccinylase/aspartoacylase family protein, partial [Halioglobus sp.]|nr:succinylglutamate desuccinylase/aspartoacylase family protein [Halioglobus sp.]